MADVEGEREPLLDVSASTVQFPDAEARGQYGHRKLVVDARINVSLFFVYLRNFISFAYSGLMGACCSVRVVL